MQFVFTYIRKPVGPGELWGRAACACRGASAALRRAGQSGAGQSGPSAAPASAALPGRDRPPPLRPREKRKNLPGAKMEEQVCQADPRSCGVAEPGCGTGRSEVCASSCCSLWNGRGAPCGLRGRAGGAAEQLPQLLWRSVCSSVDAPSFYWEILKLSQLRWNTAGSRDWKLSWDALVCWLKSCKSTILPS